MTCRFSNASDADHIRSISVPASLHSRATEDIMKKIKTATIYIFLAFLFSIPAFGQITNRAGEIWKPVEVEGSKVVVTNAYVNFMPGQRRFTGNTGCNQMAGNVTATSHSRIHITGTATTRRACKMMEGSVPEDTFLRSLNNAARYRRHGQTLDLFDKSGKRVVRFVSTPKDAPDDGNVGTAGGLADQKWYLESIGNRKTLVAITGVFVNFIAEKGTAGGDTACNAFGGSYSAGKSNIRITDIMSTMRACEEGGKMQLEREFLDGLRNATRYEIRDNHLHLYRKSALLLTFRGEPKG
jgi:heat shock protein HslJ